MYVCVCVCVCVAIYVETPSPQYSPGNIPRSRESKRPADVETNSGLSHAIIFIARFVLLPVVVANKRMFSDISDQNACQ